MEQINAHGGTITIIHFVKEREGLSENKWQIVCMPNMTEFHETMYHPNYPRSNDPRGVTCPACKKTDDYKRAMEAINNSKGASRATK